MLILGKAIFLGLPTMYIKILFLSFPFSIGMLSTSYKATFSILERGHIMCSLYSNVAEKGSEANDTGEPHIKINGQAKSDVTMNHGKISNFPDEIAYVRFSPYQHSS